MTQGKKIKVAMPAWEIGRTSSGFGAKTGGLGAVLEELPEELISAAERRGINLKVEVLAPCFAHYDRKALQKLRFKVPARLEGTDFSYVVFRREISPELSIVYFWDDWQLNWTSKDSIYPSDPDISFKLFSSVCQAMAGYILRRRFNVVHAHDYHVAITPHYLGDQYLREVPFNLTIHNATYQGLYPVHGHGFEMLNRINLPGEELFHKYFDFFDNLNFLKAGMLKTHESGGKITTVSGDLRGGWGYAAELRQTAAGVYERARALKEWREVREVFVPNRHLDVFERLPILGITNGISSQNRPENLPELKADVLKSLQLELPGRETLFRNREVMRQMLSGDHNFSKGTLSTKKKLKRLLHLEAFGTEPGQETILITAVGRLVEQKNLGLVADIVEPVFKYDPGAKFVVLASAPDGDQSGKAVEARFAELANRHPDRFFFDNRFNRPLSKLILAGGDFILIPSRFEPCGLVDLEASLVGNIVIGHKIGGLAKVSHCAYLYEWLDIGDRNGELTAFFTQVRQAIRAYRDNPRGHRRLLKLAMSIDAGWEKSAELYIQLYEFGLLYKKWLKKRESMLRGVDRYGTALFNDHPHFSEFFSPIDEDPFELRLDRVLRRLRTR